jgi:hypothetical protein
MVHGAASAIIMVSSNAGYRAVFQFVCGILRVEQGGFFFHPTDEGLSVGAPVDEKPT